METIFYTVIRHLHSVVRWLLLSGLLAAIIFAISGLSSGNGLGTKGRLYARITMYLAHSQFLVGILLFFLSPRVVFSADSMQSPILRFFLVEHTAAMILAIILITVGHARMRKARDEVRSARTLLWFYCISLVIILVLIPWPFSRYAGHYL